MVYAVLVAVLAVRFSFYFTGQVLTGWDTLGHLHLARRYADLFPTQSSGFDSAWFQGFPAFYFYPPFFYFLVNTLALAPGLSIVHAFNLGIFLSLTFTVVSIVRLTAVMFQEPGRSLQPHLAGAAAAMFYVSYPGDGLQGTSAAGVLSGTIVSTLGHGMILQILTALVEYRRKPQWFTLGIAVAWISLLLYTHLLSSAFAGILVVSFVLYFRKDFRISRILFLFIGPIVLALPVILRFAARSGYANGSPYHSYYPALLSIFGTDFFQAAFTGNFRTLAHQFVFDGKYLTFGFIFLWGWGILRAMRGMLALEQSWLVCMALLFFWFSADNSLSYMLPFLQVHWYRAFDFFLIAASITAAGTIPALGGFLPTSRRSFLLPVILLLLALRFLTWDIRAQQGYPDIRFDSHTDEAELKDLRLRLRQLPAGSLFLPELIREKEYQGSPHALLHILEEGGHRSLLGLTIESSLTPRITYARLFAGLSRIFVWGMDHIEIHRMMAATGGENPRLLADYLRSAGVRFLIGRSADMKSFADRFPSDFRPVFQLERVFVYEVLDPAPDVEGPAKPFAWVDAGALLGRPRETPRDFLLRAATVRNALPGLPLIVRLTEDYDKVSTAERKMFAGLIVYADPETSPAAGTLPLRGWEGLPVILAHTRPPWDDRHTVLVRAPDGKWMVRFGSVPPQRLQPSTRIIPASITDSTIVAEAGAAESAPAWAHVRRSFFPDWRSPDETTRIFQSELNTMFVESASPRLVLKFEDPFSRWIAFVLVVLPVALALLVMFRKRGAGGSPGP